MSETASTMLPLNTIAPSFILKDSISEKNLSLAELKSNVATVIMFICNHCPYVMHILKALVALSDEFQHQQINFVAISSNDIIAYPADQPKYMQQLAKEYHFNFPYLFDESQQVARAYHAVCTPDFFVFDKNMQCVYRGRFDNATPSNHHPVTGNDLKAALKAILKGEEISSDQLPSLGCNIKWKKL